MPIPRLLSVMLAGLWLGACSSAPLRPEHSAVTRDQRAPIGIVAARYLPEAGAEFQITGRGSGAATGAAGGSLACVQAAATMAPIAPIVYLVCLPIGLTVGSVAGAIVSEDADTLKRAGDSARTALEQLRTQQTFAEAVTAYARRHGLEVSLATDIEGPANPKARTELDASQRGRYGTVIEVSLRQLRFHGTGWRHQPMCLNVVVQARRLDGATGREIDRIVRNHDAGCRAFNDWAAAGGQPMLDAVQQAQQWAAQDLVDELFLLYYPPMPKAVPAASAHLPWYALRPLTPPVAAPKVDLGAALLAGFGRVPKRFIAFGGTPFADLDTLTPVFSWAPADSLFAPGMAVEDVRYELRVFRGRTRTGSLFVAADDLVYARDGLSMTTHRIETPLDYCGWYFWSVRAHFRLNGQPRVSEWAGVYTAPGAGGLLPAWRRAGGEEGSPVSPTSQFFPLRTPADPRWDNCWESAQIMKQMGRMPGD